MKLKPGTEAEYAKYKSINAADGYSKAVVDFGEQWADLMEVGLAAGKTVAQIAQEASSQADTDGITGFMYGAAVSALSHFWEHGDALRAWHNREYLPEDKAQEADKSGGVVNPAILTINV
jgi:hypothetical protein